MPSREEIKVIDVFMCMPFSEMSISEIMKKSGKKSKTWVFKVLGSLEKEGALKMNRKGNVNLYRANLDSPAIIGKFLLIENLKLAGSGQQDIISRIVSSIPVKNYCLIIFGSYAEGKQKPGSDIDICFLSDSGEMEKKIRPYMNEIKLKSNARIDEHYITHQEFMEMLRRDEENLGKQIYKKHILAFNGAIFYEAIREAGRNGFQG
jgi:predicted nucleotidyltransferase